MSATFSGFDFAAFWDNTDYAHQEYIGGPLTPAMLRAFENDVGYALPASYIEFLSLQNGGTPRLTNHRTSERTSWAPDHVAITGIYGLDPAKPSSLLGEFGTKFWISAWGYPDIGVYFADCPSAGHDMLCMDYSACGARGEPRIVHVDQEYDYKVTFVAPSFEAFIRGLEPESAFSI